MTQWGLDTLFNPAKRHMDDEKRRLQSTREEVGDSSGGKRIDLESGKVVIHREDDDDAAATGELTEAAAAETAPADQKSRRARPSLRRRKLRPRPAPVRARRRPRQLRSKHRQ